MMPASEVGRPEPDGRYAGKSAVVLGGTHGIGLATARALLTGGATVAFTGRREETVRAVEAELGDRSVGVACDAAQMADIDALGARVEAELDGIDFLFLNAGHAQPARLEEMTEELYDQTFAVNAKGAFFTVQRLAPLVRDGGSILFTTSIAHGGGTPGMAAYAGAKAAVRSFARVLAAELLPRSIRVNALSPGFVDTPTMGVDGFSRQQRAEFRELGDAITPMKRHGTVDEVARAALFLAFEATFTTGGELNVDGGRAERLA